MFISAIEQVAQFTRPIHTISRAWGSNTVIPGASTLFFVNDEGWALTCRHVAELLPAAEKLTTQYQEFRAERARIPQDAKRRHAVRDMERRYGYTDGQTVELSNHFMNCVEGPLELEVRVDQAVNIDVALLRFRNFTRLLCTSFPVFASDGAGLKQGKSLCRLGFPFAEFQNFEYDVVAEEIRWTTTGRRDTPRFPVDGMVTRHLGDATGALIGFEMTTPGLRGQSGGPVFDANGRIWGMQSSTRHLDLDFDVDVEVLRAGQKKRIKESAFLHVGQCIHVDVLKKMMRDNGVTFQETV